MTAGACRQRAGLRRQLGNVVAALGGLAFAWGVCEVLVRFALPVSTVEGQYDEQVGHLLRPSATSRYVGKGFDVQIVTNGAGFHDVDHAARKPPHTYRVVVLGDSMIEALQVPIDAGFTQLLQRRLQQWSAAPVEVINLGISGNGPAQYYRLLEQRGLAYQPDLVVMAVTTINDFRNTLPELEGDPVKPYYAVGADGRLSYIAPPAGVNHGVAKQLKALLKRSAAVRVVVAKIQLLQGEEWTRTAQQQVGAGEHQILPITSDWNVYLRDPPKVWQQAYTVTLRVIEECQRLSERSGARFLVMLIAPNALVEGRLMEAVSGYAGTASLHWDEQRPFRAIEQLGREEGFGVVNLLPDFQRDYTDSRVSASWEHDGHWNERGHRLAADVMDGYLRNHAHELGLRGVDVQ